MRQNDQLKLLMKRIQQSVYEQRGVSSTKADIHQAIQNLDKGLFPGAFCKILPDILAGSPHHCNILHHDTAGTKAGLAHLVWKLTGNLEAVAGVAVDALVMNTDDVGCVGAINGLIVNQAIGRNGFLIPGEVIQVIIESAERFCQMLSKWGVPCFFAGGETASVGDIVRTVDVGSSVVVRMRRRDVIDASRMVPGDIIVGFSSTGRATYENEDNSGIGANGLTNARHDTLRPLYRRYRETYAPEMSKKLVYRGRYKIDDPLPQDSKFWIWKALLSPTRTYMPLIKLVLENVNRRHIHGIIHCSGGGQTKIVKFGRHGNRYVKKNLFPVPPLFQMLQEVSGLLWKEMYQTYNMGHRLEMAVPDNETANELIAISRHFKIDAQVVGEVRPKLGPGPNKVVIESPYGTFEYL